METSLIIYIFYNSYNIKDYRIGHSTFVSLGNVYDSTMYGCTINVQSLTSEHLSFIISS